MFFISDQFTICEILLSCPNLNVNYDYGDPYFTPLQHAWKCIYSFEIASAICEKIINHPQFKMHRKHTLCYRYWPAVDTVKQKTLLNWLVNVGIQFAPGKSPKLFEVENLFELCTLIDFQAQEINMPTLKQLCRQTIRSQLIKPTSKSIDKDRLQTILPLPEELCIFLADKSIK